MAQNVAAFLDSRGVRPGDRVCSMLGNSAWSIASFFGCWLTGAVAVPVSQSSPMRRLTFVVRETAACGILGRQGSLSLLGSSTTDLKRFEPESIPALEGCSWLSCAPRSDVEGTSDLRTAAILFTGGTSGRPKGVCLSHSNLTQAAGRIQNYLKLNDSDRVLIATDFSHCAGLLQLLAHLRSGASVATGPTMTAPSEVIEAVRTLCVTGFPCVPSTARVLLDRASRAFVSACSGLRYLELSSAPSTSDLIAELAEALPTTALHNTYGLTEAARITYHDARLDLPSSPSVGTENPGMQIRILREDGRECDPGEVGSIEVRGPTVALGYWERPEEEIRRFRDGAFITGDLGFRNTDGRIFLRGRLDEMIKSGAYSVYPTEIEEVIQRIDGVREAAVYSAPHNVYGQEIRASVVLSNIDLSRAEIQRRCRLSLDPAQRPRQIEFCVSLPKTPAGKLDRKALAPTERHGKR